MGSSNWFKTKVRKISLSSASSQPDLEKVFDDELGKEIFSKMKEGAAKNYEDLISRERSNILILPPVFQYNKRIGMHDTVVPEKLQKICDQLRSKGNNSNQVKKIQNFLHF